MAEEINPGELEIADELIAERRSASPGELPDDMNPTHRKIIGFIDTLNEWVGRIVAWLLVPLCLIVVYEVVVRNLGLDPTLYLPELKRKIVGMWTGVEEPSLVKFAPTLWAYDLTRMIYGAMFMLGAGYGLSKGIHIRADFLYRNWSDRTQGSVDFLLYCIFYFPGMAFLFYNGFDYAYGAFEKGEKAMDTAFMPLLWPVRMAIPFGVFFLIIQGLSETLKSWYAMTRGRWPV